MGKRKMNEGVPEETTMKYKLRDVMVENGKLKSEIEYLRFELEKRDKAIAAFKKWQRRCAEYNYQYWLQQGIKLLEEQPEEREFKALFALLNHWTYFRTRFKTLLGNIRHMDSARKVLLKLIEEQEVINQQKQENNEHQS